MVTELMLGQAIYFVAGELIIILFTQLLHRGNLLQPALGFFDGVAAAIAVMLHMAVSVEDSVSMYEDEALKHTRKNYIIRMLMLLVIFLLIGFFGTGDILAAVFGLMSLKVSAYIQPFTHKIITK